MKIAFISQPFEYISHKKLATSVWIQTYEVIKALGSQPVEFFVYSKKFSDLPKFEEAEGIKFYRFPTWIDEIIAKPIRLVEILLGYPNPKRPYFSSSVQSLAYVLQISKDLQKRDIDIVHIFNYSQFAPVIKRFNPDIKIVVHMTCDWLSQLDRNMIEHRLGMVDRVVGCSNHVVTQVQKRFPQYADKTRTIYNGVHVESFSKEYGDISENQKYPDKQLLFVGRLSPEKGIHTLLDAFDIVVGQFPDAKLDIVGAPGSAPFEYMVLVSDDPKVKALSRFYPGILKRGGYLSKLQDHITPKTRSRINFAGSFPHEDVISYYHQADILINPSLTEAFGMSLVEAMACKVPVIATNIGGMKEIVDDEKTGLTVKADNPTDLANAILRLLQSENIKKSMGEAGLARAINLFTWDNVANNLWDLYSELQSNKGL